MWDGPFVYSGGEVVEFLSLQDLEPWDSWWEGQVSPWLTSGVDWECVKGRSDDETYILAENILPHVMRQRRKTSKTIKFEERWYFFRERLLLAGQEQAGPMSDIASNLIIFWFQFHRSAFRRKTKRVLGHVSDESQDCCCDRGHLFMELNDRNVFRPEIMRSFLRRIALLFVTWVLGVKRLGGWD